MMAFSSWERGERVELVPQHVASNRLFLSGLRQYQAAPRARFLSTEA